MTAGGGARSPDLTRILLANGTRMVGYGMLDVMLGVYLAARGFDPLRIGVFIAATLAGSALLNLLIVASVGRTGRRAMLIAMNLTMIAAGLVLLASGSFIACLIAALTGTLNFTGPITSGFASIDQSTIPGVAPAAARTHAFGLYNSTAIVGRMAGAVMSGLPIPLQQLWGIPLVDGYRVALGLFVALGLASTLVCTGLSEAVEAEASASTRRSPLKAITRSGVGKMSALLAMDAMATGFIPQSLIVLWFSLRFGVGVGVMGPVYAVVRLLQAAGYQLAVRLADRIGLLNAMVLTHLPSQALLLTLPLMGSPGSAIAVLVLQQTLSNMDIPVRQAYIARLVPPEERTAAAGATNLSRNVAQALSPSLSGWALTAFAYGLPFVLSASFGTLYDVLLYATFRRRPLQADRLSGAGHP